jgi:hypothetical protein
VLVRGCNPVEPYQPAEALATGFGSRVNIARALQLVGGCPTQSRLAAIVLIVLRRRCDDQWALNLIANP